MQRLETHEVSGLHAVAHGSLHESARRYPAVARMFIKICMGSGAPGPITIFIILFVIICMFTLTCMFTHIYI